jgi:hypothetical protein
MVNVDKIHLLIKVGQALYGERWQTDLTTALGVADARRMRQWVAGDRPIPKGVWKDLRALLESRNSDIILLLNEFETLEKAADGIETNN